MKEQVLKERGITAETAHHNYDYLYKSIVLAMDEYAEKVAHTFDKWKIDNYWKFINPVWCNMVDNTIGPYTPKELFEIFKQETGL